MAVKNALSHQTVNQLAFHDVLTGLPNRAHLNKRLEEEMERAQRGETAGAVMFIDLDDLKTVNDHLGHTYGDSVIVAAGAGHRRLRPARGFLSPESAATNLWSFCRKRT